MMIKLSFLSIIRYERGHKTRDIYNGKKLLLFWFWKQFEIIIGYKMNYVSTIYTFIFFGLTTTIPNYAFRSYP